MKQWTPFLWGYALNMGSEWDEQELLALLGTAAVTPRLVPSNTDHRQISSDCTSLVDYVNHYWYT